MIKDTYNTLSKRHWLRSIVMPLGWIFHSFIWEYLERANRGQASMMAINHFLTFQSPDNSIEVNHKYNQFSQNLGEALEKMSWSFSGLSVMRIKTACFLRNHCITPSVQRCYLPTLAAFCIGYLFLCNNLPQTQQIKTAGTEYFTLGQAFGSSLVRCHWAKVSHTFAIKLSAMAEVTYKA